MVTQGCDYREESSPWTSPTSRGKTASKNFGLFFRDSQCYGSLQAHLVEVQWLCNFIFV
jgi:hypothetical protein